MDNLENDYLETIRSFKLERAKDEILKEVSKGNINNAVNSITQIVKSFSSGNPLPILLKLMNTYETLKSGISYYGLKKHIEFFVRLDEVSLDNREQFVKELEENIDLKEHYCASISMIIDRVTELEKIKVIANINIARINRDINDELFFRLMHIIDKLNWYEIHCIYLREYYHEKQLFSKADKEKEYNMDHSIIQNIMINNGLLKMKNEIKESRLKDFTGKEGWYLETKLSKTNLGRIFIATAFRNFEYSIKSEYNRPD